MQWSLCCLSRTLGLALSCVSMPFSQAWPAVSNHVAHAATVYILQVLQHLVLTTSENATSNLTPRHDTVGLSTYPGQIVHGRMNVTRWEMRVSCSAHVSYGRLRVMYGEAAHRRKRSMRGFSPGTGGQRSSSGVCSTTFWSQYVMEGWRERAASMASTVAVLFFTASCAPTTQMYPASHMNVSTCCLICPASGLHCTVVTQ